MKRINVRRLLHRAVVLCVVFLFALALGVRAYDWLRGDEVIAYSLVDDSFEAFEPTKNELVVVLHGWNSGPEEMEEVARLAGDARPNSDVFVADYPASALTNANPSTIADNLRAELADVFAERGYERIDLVGHSAGGMILRRAYLDGLREQAPWAAAVDRVILLAGMNRGWSFDSGPTNMHPLRRLVRTAFMQAARVTLTGRFIRGMQRGAPFIADVRLDWVRRRLDEQDAAAGSLPICPVYQVLGFSDDLVTRSDSADLVVAEDFRFLEVVGDHTTIRHVKPKERDDPEDFLDAQARERLLTQLLTEEHAELKGLALPDVRSPQMASPHRARVDHIVFVVHGIRDEARWMGLVEQAIATENVALGRDEHVRVVRMEYGYFPMGSFLLSPARDVYVRRFADKYAEEVALANNSNVRVSFVGHSNGTYLLSQSLVQYDEVKFANIYLAGSVIPRGFAWGDRAGKFKTLRNDRGSEDWVVAIFPRVFEMLATFVGADDAQWLGELGSGGFNGFDFFNPTSPDEPATLVHKGDEYSACEFIVEGRHSAGLVRGNHTSIAKFVLTGDLTEPDQLADGRGSFVKWLTAWAPAIWVLLLAALVILGRTVVRLAAVRGIPRWAGGWLYVAVLVWIVQHV